MVGNYPAGSSDWIVTGDLPYILIIWHPEIGWNGRCLTTRQDFCTALWPWGPTVEVLSSRDPWCMMLAKLLLAVAIGFQDRYPLIYIIWTIGQNWLSFWPMPRAPAGNLALGTHPRGHWDSAKEICMVGNYPADSSDWIVIRWFALYTDHLTPWNWLKWEVPHHSARFICRLYRPIITLIYSNWLW